MAPYANASQVAIGSLVRTDFVIMRGFIDIITQPEARGKATATPLNRDC